MAADQPTKMFHVLWGYDRQIKAEYAEHGVPLSVPWEILAPHGAVCILGGDGSIGPHAVVGIGGKIVFDPNQNRNGLKTITDVAVLIPFDPARGLRRPASYEERAVALIQGNWSYEENPLRDRCPGNCVLSAGHEGSCVPS